MPIKFPPSAGAILKCNFLDFKSPEMTKIRPVVVLSPRLEHGKRSTFLIVPLSTTEPQIIYDYHLKVTLPGVILPKGLSRECWVKGDMVYSLRMERLSFYQFNRNKETGSRSYYKERFFGDDLINIRKTLISAIGLK